MTSVPIVIADSSPINYLVLIGHIGVLPELFDKIILPSAVQSELSRPKAPQAVREWIANAPVWLEVRSAPVVLDPALADLDDGERAAIALATELKADLLLIDERRGTRAARSKGFRVAGTLAILGLAARRDLLVLADALERLKRTSFRYSQKILDQFLAEQRGKGKLPWLPLAPALIAIKRRPRVRRRPLSPRQESPATKPLVDLPVGLFYRDSIRFLHFLDATLEGQVARQWPLPASQGRAPILLKCA